LKTTGVLQDPAEAFVEALGAAMQDVAQSEDKKPAVVE
jgi:hypothetical protein